MHKYNVHLANGGTRISLGNSFIYLALGVIIFFAGFRFEIGYDYPKYLAGYLYDDELKHWEPLFNFFVRVIRVMDFGIGIQAMFLFFSTITVAIAYAALRSLSSHYRLGILFYLLIPALFLNSFSVIRQGIALVVLLYGLQFIVKENPEYKKYIITAIIAFFFHYSSVFVVLIYLFGAQFFKRVYSWLFYAFLIVVSFFLSFVHIGKALLLVMPGHFSVYADNLGFTVSPLKLIIVNGFFIFFLLQKDNFLHTKRDIYLFNSIFIGLLIFNVFSDFVFVSRLAQYFLAMQIILVPIYLYSIKDTLVRKVMLILFLVYYLFDFNYSLYRDMQYSVIRDHYLIPYKNYFFEEEEKSNRNLNIEAWYNYILEATQKEEEK